MGFLSHAFLAAGGAAFYDGEVPEAADLEAQMWIEHVLDDSKPLLAKPEQALVVTQILEAIYKYAETGEPVKF